MKLLFKNHQELKNSLGFLDADLSFENFKTDLEHATLDLINLIGTATYNAISAYYEDINGYSPGQDDPTAEQMSALLKKAQDPIAMFANLAIEANTDLSHTNAGRTVKIGSDEKQPWEWQINRDNSAQFRRAFRALDVLINELDTLSYTPWLQSDEFKASKQYFIYTTRQFDKIYGINNSRSLYIKLQPFMEDAEEEHIEPVIGTTKYAELKENILDNSVPTSDAALLKRIQKAVAFFALADAFKTLPVEMFPEGLIEYREKGRIPSKSRQETMNFFSDKAKFHIAKLEDLVNAIENVETDTIDPITGIDDGEKFVNL